MDPPATGRTVICTGTFVVEPHQTESPEPQSLVQAGSTKLFLSLTRTDLVNNQSGIARLSFDHEIATA